MIDDFNLLDIPTVDPDVGPLHVMRVNETWLQYVIGAVETLTSRDIWNGDDSELDTVENQVDTLLAMLAENFRMHQIGDIGMTFASTLPDDRLWCDGSLVSLSEYPELQQVLNADILLPVNKFRVPDLRDRVPVGAGGAYQVGETGGTSSVTLTQSNLPSVNLTPGNGHPAFVTRYTGGLDAVLRGQGSGDFRYGATSATIPMGNDEPFSVVQPYAACRFWIQAK